MNINKIRASVMLTMLVGMIVTVLSQQIAFAAGTIPVTTALSTELCNVVNSIKTIIGIFALLLFILGGVLYAVAHFLPTAGNLRSGMQGWGMGMLMAGVIALIIYLVAPFILHTLIGIGGTTGGGGTGYTSVSISC